jgi:4-carboxymuconolactone decarboxylase
MTHSTDTAGRQLVREVFGEQLEGFLDDRIQRRAFGASTTEAALQHVFGDTWTRPGLDRKSRSIATLAMQVVLRSMDEFKFQVAGAINNGCTVEEIEELILHSAYYAGFPAAAAALRAAEEVLTEMGLLDGRS